MRPIAKLILSSETSSAALAKAASTADASSSVVISREFGWSILKALLHGQSAMEVGHEYHGAPDVSDIQSVEATHDELEALLIASEDSQQRPAESMP